MSDEISSLTRRASELYYEYGMDQLPKALQRNSLDYYYLSIYPGLKEMSLSVPCPTYPEAVHNAYIHIPYCTGVCNFCSYFLTTVSMADRSPITEYLEDVKSEIVRHQAFTNLDLSYIYFGGGTPSLIPVETLDSFLEFMADRQVLRDSLLGTVELHPEFFSNYHEARKFIDVLKFHGIHRVSVGFQSSEEEILQRTSRRHGATFLVAAMEFLKSNGMRVNLDLMYGLPGLGLRQWEDTLIDAARCQPDSVSTYFLFVDKGTALHASVERSPNVLPGHMHIQVQHIMAQKFLEERGYRELPNDFYTKVNSYDFPAIELPSDAVSLPLGAGSYGYYDRTQFATPFSLAEYRRRVHGRESLVWRGHKFDDDGLMRRDVMFSFKNVPYIDRDLFRSRYGVDPVERYAEKFEILQRYDLAKIDDAADRVALTRKGRLCVEEISCLFRIPGLQERLSSVSTLGERKKLEKYNFSPTYPPLLDQ